jgi:hypothetical protein
MELKSIVNKLFSKLNSEKKKPNTFRLNDNLWGFNITWFDNNEVAETLKQMSITQQPMTFRVVGHYSPIPLEGDILIAELQKSFLHCYFTKVKQCQDLMDMFFADVIPFKKEMKA